MRKILALCLIATCCLYGCKTTPSVQQQMQRVVDSFYAANPAMTGVVVHVEAPDRHISWSYAVGYGDKKTKQKLDAAQPVLIASNTKTYVAASIMKLVEQGKLSTEQPIAKLLKPATAALLANAGYQLDSITLKQLMSHTSGIRDYVDNGYIDTINAHKQHQWTRDEQIARAVSIGGPYAHPADSFRYADLNYLLLTEVLETTTQQPFYTAIRALLNYKKAGIDNTWFVHLEPAPAGLPAFAHQYWEKYHWDSYDLDPSWDLYGGGGIAATTKDIALFYQQLWGGNIIINKQVLNLMTQDVPSTTPGNYCLGVRKLSVTGIQGYYHGGFWGTDVIYYPQLNTSIAVTCLEKTKRDLSGLINKQLTILLKEKQQ